jgi:uncharacterized membrane protein
MTANIALSIAAGIVIYTLFGIFNAQAGGRIDAALSSTVFNGLAALISLGVVLWQRHANESAPATAQLSGVVYSLLAGVAVGVFSILLIGIYGRGGELSYVFPTIYGGAIALTAVIGWLLLGDAVNVMRVVGVGAIVAGIGLLAAN